MIGLLAIAGVGLAFGAASRSSATFDEIVLVSGGVRGLETGRWEMITDQPPLMMMLYGAAASGAVEALPTEARPWSFDDRWDYARALFFGLGNDTAALLGRPRVVASLLAGVTIAVAGAFGWWAAGPLAGVLAAALTALIPDVLAHGGVAYNDLPLALAFLLAVWAFDALVRRPTPVRGAVAGFAVAAALGIKMSALALAPVALLVLGVEGWRRHREKGWAVHVAVAGMIAVAALYVGLVVLYRGDPTLTLFRFNVWRTVLHASGGHEAPAYLLGQTSAAGWWYYFPIAALFKTPIAFQAAVVCAAWFGGRAWWTGATDGESGRSNRDRVEAGLAWRGRAAVIGAVVFGAFLIRSDLNAGFRYALPALPLIAVATAVGLARPWGCCRGAKGVLIGGLLGLQALSVLSAYPHFLAYSSVWAGGRDRAWRVLADSNLDWGQGLLELRDFIQEEGVDGVRLSYFGSAPPEAYGIEYVALPSFFRLSRARTAGAPGEPRFTVISATNLVGLYLQGFDPFAAYRERVPYRVLGHALFVFDEEAGGGAEEDVGPGG